MNLVRRTPDNPESNRLAANGGKKEMENVEETDSAEGQTLKIQTQTWNEAKQEALEKARRVDEGKEVEETDITFVEPADVQRLLTPKRVEMIETLMSEDIEVESIRGLAEALDRNPSEVHDDVHTLVEYGIVELRKEGRAKKPIIPYDDIDINVNISRSEEVPV